MEGTLQHESELLTTKEAANYLKLSAKSGHLTIGRWVRQGQLKAGQVGSAYRFRKQDLDDFTFSKK